MHIYLKLIYFLEKSFTWKSEKWAELAQILPFNSLPDNKILDWSKSKPIVDDILKCI